MTGGSDDSKIRIDGVRRMSSLKERGKRKGANFQFGKIRTTSSSKRKRSKVKEEGNH
jgi:hypothetical protein